MQMYIARGIALVGTLAALGACGGGGGGDGGGGNNPVTTVAMAAPSGNAQNDTIQAPLPLPLRVEVKEDGAVKQGVTVNWSVQSGGGQVAPASGVTGVDGVAATTWTLGTTVGAQTARATVAGATGSPVTFTATAAHGNPAQLTVNGGDNQTGLADAAFGTLLSVKLVDRLNNAISGAVVNWAVGSGPLTLGAATSNTNAQGIATVGVTAGSTAGSGTIQATTAGVAGQVVFDLTVVVAARQVNVGPGVTFRSVRNNTQNPAVDTVQAGETVLWQNQGQTHTVQSIGNGFTSSGNLVGAGVNYLVTFPNPGNFQYNCAIHGNLMTGTIVVQ